MSVSYTHLDVYKRQILTSEFIVTHPILSVQLQKGAYLFLYVSHTILIPSNQKLQINYGGIIMANYTKTTTGKENRIELHEMCIRDRSGQGEHSVKSYKGIKRTHYNESFVFKFSLEI